MQVWRRTFKMVKAITDHPGSMLHVAVAKNHFALINKMSVNGATRSLNSQLVTAQQCGAYSAQSNRGDSEKPQKRNNALLLKLQGIFAAARPNRSLNRTLHSVPVFVPAKTLAQIPSRCSGPVSFDVRPHQRHAYSLPVNPRRSCGTHHNTPCTSDARLEY